MPVKVMLQGNISAAQGTPGNKQVVFPPNDSILSGIGQHQTPQKWQGSDRS